MIAGYDRRHHPEVVTPGVIIPFRATSSKSGNDLAPRRAPQSSQPRSRARAMAAGREETSSLWYKRWMYVLTVL